MFAPVHIDFTDLSLLVKPLQRNQFHTKIGLRTILKIIWIFAPHIGDSSIASELHTIDSLLLSLSSKLLIFLLFQVVSNSQS